MDGTVVLIDRALANAAFADEGLYQRAWLYVASVEYRAASFQAYSGALVTVQRAVNAIPSGADFEIHELLSPSEKDRCIDDAVKRLRVKREVGLNTVDGLTIYSLGEGLDVLDVYYHSSPHGSLTHGHRDLAQWDVQRTATGMELRIDPALAGSQQLILDAILTLTLGAGDDATVSLPDERLILTGAAAKCYDLLSARAPGQEAEQYRRRRGEMAREFTRLAHLHKPQIDRKLEFDQPFVSVGWAWD